MKLCLQLAVVKELRRRACDWMVLLNFCDKYMYSYSSTAMRPSANQERNPASDLFEIERGLILQVGGVRSES